jgi:hypothetical protein
MARATSSGARSAPARGGVVCCGSPPDKKSLQRRLRAIVGGKFDAPPLSKEIRAFVDWVAHALTTRGMVLG